MTHRILGSMIASGILLGFAPASAQTSPRPGLYQITAGTYSECCGLVGTPFAYELPFESHAYVRLAVDNNTAALTFLTDPETIFSVRPCPATPAIVFSFGEGMISSNRIDFRRPPEFISWHYVVTFSGTTLLINGSLGTSPPFCWDTPTRFNHTNVIAELIVAAPQAQPPTRRGDLLQFSFTGEPPHDYFVEYSHAFPATNWLTLTNYRAAGAVIHPLVTDSATNAPGRFYRIRQSPALAAESTMKAR